MQETPSHNSLWFLMARSLAKEASAEEEQILQDVLQHDIYLQQQYELLRRMWHSGNHFDINDDEQEKENISHILRMAEAKQEKLTPQNEDEKQSTTDVNNIQRKFLIAISSVAAFIVLSVAVWIFGRHSISSKSTIEAKPDARELVAQNGSKTRTILPDGSTVWLNAGSKISYSQDFSGATREVKLEGEAFFDVVKDAKHPFIVHVASYDIRVLGTAFNVKSYPEDKTVETTLLRGLVQVTKHGKQNERPIFLHPNEKLIVTKIAANDVKPLPYVQSATPERKYTITPIDSAVEEKERIETAWVYNRLEFKDDDFEELANKLERWYNVTIIFDDDAVKKINLHGAFENETIDQALAALKIATPFNYTISGGTIHISSLTKK